MKNSTYCPILQTRIAKFFLSRASKNNWPSYLATHWRPVRDHSLSSKFTFPSKFTLINKKGRVRILSPASFDLEFHRRRIKGDSILSFQISSPHTIIRHHHSVEACGWNFTWMILISSCLWEWFRFVSFLAAKIGEVCHCVLFTPHKQGQEYVRISFRNERISPLFHSR